MSNYILSCCSTADLTTEQLSNREISYICFHYMLNDESYLDDLGQSMSLEDFYQRLVNGDEPKTSQVGVGEYEDYFRSFLIEGRDIIHVTLSSGISGSYNSACVARDMLADEFPDRKIYIIDSLSASSGYGLLMDKLADKRDEGLSIDELNAWALENRLRLQHWFFSSDLTFFIKGGRVSKTAGTIGNLLNICPLLNVNAEGKLIVREKIRTKKKAIKAAVAKMEEFADNGLSYNGKCFISQSACYEDAKAVADLVADTFKNLDGDVVINSIGTTIGSHTGPGTVALFFWGAERTE
ncbi:MAG: DegV family protein [Eubacteriales bacterium]|nr:DegV family protein [Eubacteriales bacterium]